MSLTVEALREDPECVAILTTAIRSVLADREAAEAMPA
jgi:hypothetical protein